LRIIERGFLILSTDHLSFTHLLLWATVVDLKKRLTNDGRAFFGLDT